MIVYEFENLFRQDSVSRSILIDVSKFSGTSFVLTNTDLIKGSLSIKDSLCSDTNLRFGKIEGAEFSFTTTKTDFDYIYSLISVRCRPNGATSYLSIPLGFIAVEEKYSSDKSRKFIRCVDLNYFLNKTDVSSWYNSLTFPMTLQQFRYSLFNLNPIIVNGASAPISQAYTSSNVLVNDNMTVERTIAPNQLSMAEVLRAICEVNGVFGHFYYTNFTYVSLQKFSTGLYPANDLYPADDLYPEEPGTATSGTDAIDIGENGNYINANFEDYFVKPIDKLQIRTEENDIGVIVGTGDNTYVVEDNFLLYGKGTAELTTIANNLLGQIGGISYVPCNIEIKGNPCLQVGDPIRLKTKNGYIVSYIMQRTLSGSQFLRDKYTATGDEYYTEENVGYNYDIKKLRGKSNVLSRTIEETRSELSSFETNVNDNYSTTTEMNSAISQSATDILSTVSSTYTTQSTFNSTVSNLQDQIDDNIETFTGSVVPTLNNAPASSWTTDTEKDKHIGDLYMVNSSGGSYAGFYYRFEKNNNVYSWVLLKDSEVTKALQDSAQALQDVSDLSTNLSTNYSTTVQMNSAIDQSASAIESTVSKAVSKYDEESYSIDYYGYGAPTLLAQGNNGKYYLNQSNGYLYLSNNTAWSKVDELDLITDNLATAISQTANDISAEVTRATTAENSKVNATDHNSSNTFGWTLTTSGFDVKSNGNTVFKVNSSGAEIDGKVTAKSGYIGNGSSGFTIGNTNIRNGMTSLSDTTNEGIYLGTNGIALGKGNFKVTKAGVVTLNGGTSSSLYIGDSTNGYTQINNSGLKTYNGTSIVQITKSNVSFGGYGSGHGVAIYPSGYSSRYGCAYLDTGIYLSSSSAVNDVSWFDQYSLSVNAGCTLNARPNQTPQISTGGNLIVLGTKSREVSTEDYGDRFLYCYETPSPMFGDIGEGEIASDGKCYIQIEPTFSETIQTSQYQVFLQKYGQGECYVSERHPTYFIVEGSAGLSFGWEIKAKQSDFTQLRLEKDFGNADMEQQNYGDLGIEHITQINNERRAE